MLPLSTNQFGMLTITHIVIFREYCLVNAQDVPIGLYLIYMKYFVIFRTFVS
ncbi:hypothetical protein SAMN05518672_103616 [Chitinophaga sp. CF118]|nr:hypothetical protein SAMN05518672_103616 [Chitinophaga sp. CF118]